MSEARAAGGVRFDVGELEARFSPLESLGRRLWLAAVVNTQGEPVPRLRVLCTLRARLLAGEPPLRLGDRWPEPDIAQAFRAACARLPLNTLARGSEEVSDQVLRSLLWHLDQVVELESRVPRQGAIEQLAQAFLDDWQTRFEDLQEVLRVFETLDLAASVARWSELRGLLRSQRWQHVLEARERIERLPGVAALIRRLGRARDAPEPEHVVEMLPVASLRSPQRWVTRTREVDLPGAPLETEGVRRSGEFDRMLSSELLQWRRRRRFLAARRAEQTLLSYQHRQFGLETVRVRAPGHSRDEKPRRTPRPQAGPMILCVDTSASMAGAPERVAKALVLEAARVAGANRRDCLLFAFSGPGDLLRLELGTGPDALSAVAGFLERSFHGGTDVCEPLEAALEAIASERWEMSDLLIASDGEFGAPAALRERVTAARARLGLRVQGVLISDRETIGMSELCGDVFWVRDWRMFGAYGQVESPVHASNLTELYFPGAFARGGGPDRGPTAPG
ncbi:MAG: VWA domain-containing protein [Burkholderiaceae bacterium]|nr:VWA domain-containing protein [Burkholderiaceae bacterium]